jgi:hypothetical protein
MGTLLQSALLSSTTHCVAKYTLNRPHPDPTPLNTVLGSDFLGSGGHSGFEAAGAGQVRIDRNNRRIPGKHLLSIMILLIPFIAKRVVAC